MSTPRRTTRRTLIALAAAGVVAAAIFVPQGDTLGRPVGSAFDPVLDAGGAACVPTKGGPPPLLRGLVLVKAETAPFQPASMKAAGGDVPLYPGLGKLHWRITTSNRKAQAYFDQGLRLAFGFNHAEAQRAFQAARRLDPDCAMCSWGEALVLGPNLNAPMMPEAHAPALAALSRAVALKGSASAKERGLIEALEARYSSDPAADRAALDATYADAMLALARRHSRDDTIVTLFAEAAMDTQPWDYWESGGARPKGRGQAIVEALETVLKRNPAHPGAIHLYIHAVEASDRPERALAPADRLGAPAPGAGHLVHMPAHIYYRLGMYRKALEVNRRAIAVDERYFATSPSDPLYKSAYYPHNIHFVMVSAQMGGDGKTATQAAAKLDASMALEVVREFAVLQPVKAAPYTTHAQFGSPEEILALPAPAPGLTLVQAMYHYARAVAQAARKDFSAAQAEIDALATIEAGADFKPFEPWGVPAKEVVQTARRVATARLADARGDLDGAAKAYEEAIAIEDALAYTEPPYWYYPVRQSLGSVRLRQGRLAEAEQAFRDSLARVRGNGWALAGLAEVHRRQGDAKALAAARQRFENAWFGPAGGPDLARL